MPTTRPTAVLAVLLFLCAGPAQAQADQRHRGFWIGFGLGAGWNNEGTPGGMLYARLGGTLSQKWLLGGELAGWGRRETVSTLLGDTDVTTTQGNATFTTLFYPLTAGGLYVKGGVGFAWVEYSTAVQDVEVSTDRQGLGTTFGVGYDIRLGSNIYLVPGFDWLFQTFDTDEGSINSSLFLLSLGLIWH
ncbi:MAG: outer membrane beta-barrel protein [Gemmatimonadota bacterium]|nr:MAG: outer membrane beta-barrel protein [Gemmatimonadota bacterium]